MAKRIKKKTSEKTDYELLLVVVKWWEEREEQKSILPGVERYVFCCCAELHPTLWDPMDYSPPDSSVHGDSPGKNSGVGCHALPQVIFPTQGSNPGLPHCRWILYCLSYQGSPRILEWVAYFFSRGSSQSRNWTGVSYIAGRFFTSWATWEAQKRV